MKTFRTFALIVLQVSSIAAQPQRPVAQVAPESYRISGTVVDATSGNPLPGANVIVVDSRRPNNLGRTARTGSDGSFVFGGVEKGKYILAARLAGGYATQGFNQHEAYSTGIAVGAGVDSEHLIFRLHRDASIRGYVTDAMGDPVVGGRVSLRMVYYTFGRRGFIFAKNAQIDDRGFYSFPHLPEGTYYVEVEAQPWYGRILPTGHPEDSTTKGDDSEIHSAYAPTYFSDVTDPQQATPIVLHSGDTASADITMQAVPTVHVRILGRPVTDGDVRAVPRIYAAGVDSTTRATSAGGWPGEDGVIDVSLPPGRYVIEGSLPEHGKSYRHEFNLTSDTTIDLSSLTPASSIHGTMQVESGKPAEDTRLLLASLSSAAEYEAPLQGKEFEFEDTLPPGRYEVYMISRTDYIRAMSATGAKVKGRLLEIETPGPVTLSLTVAAGLASVTGTAKHDGKPFAGATMMLVPRTETDGWDQFRFDQSDSDGTFMFRDVVPGEYTAVALDGGWTLASRDFDSARAYLKTGVPLIVAPLEKRAIEVEVQRIALSK